MPQEEIIYVDEHNNQVAPPSFSYPPMAMPRSDKADMLDKIKPDLIIEKIRHQLMGEELMANGKWVLNPAHKKLALTALGAWDICTLMLPVSSQNVSLSKLTDAEIRTRTYNISATVQRRAINNWKDYGIISPDQLDFIHQIVFSNTLITLKQPQDEGMRKFIQGARQENVAITNQEEGGRGKWYQRLLRR